MLQPQSQSLSACVLLRAIHHGPELQVPGPVGLEMVNGDDRSLFREIS